MKHASTQNQSHILSRVKLFLALSRTPHALLDMATPAVCALLWMGNFPPARIIVLGIITAFAGYTAVYGLNDLMDHRADTLKLRQEGFPLAAPPVQVPLPLVEIRRHRLCVHRSSPRASALPGVLWGQGYIFVQ